MKQMIEAMRFYTSQGLPVIPLCSHDHRGMTDQHKMSCKRPGKCPLIKGWQSCSVPTERQIEQWINEWPCFNIGLVLGSKSGIIEIDVDSDGGELLLQQSSGGNLSLRESSLHQITECGTFTSFRLIKYLRSL